MTPEREDIRLLKSVEEVWATAQEVMSKKVAVPSMYTWIKPTRLIEIKDGEAVLGVSNDFVRSYIVNNFMAEITDGLTAVIKSPITVRVVVDTSRSQNDAYTATIASITVLPPTDTTLREAEAQSFFGGSVEGAGEDMVDADAVADSVPEKVYNPQTYAAAVNAAAQYRDSTKARNDAVSISSSGSQGNFGTGIAGGLNRANLSPKYTFDTFVAGAHNRFPHSAALAVAERPGQAYNPLFVYGGVGLGKTHLMQAIGHAILKHSPNLSVRYISCERFTNELINSIRDDRMMDFRKRYRQIDVLLVDDIQFIQGKESTQEEFFHTFNALRDSGRQIILSSDRPPKAISHLEERLRSRFEWGLIADIQAPDLETRLAILRKKCDLENMRVSDEVLEYIATVFTNNIRELEGALIRAHAYASLAGSTLTASVLAGILQPVGPAQKQKVTLTVERITDVVASFYRVESSELRSSKRSQDLAVPRHVAMYLAHELIQMSFPRIGQSFGNRKHTSALYAYSKVKEALATDADLLHSIQQIKQQLNV